MVNTSKPIRDLSINRSDKNVYDFDTLSNNATIDIHYGEEV